MQIAVLIDLDIIEAELRRIPEYLERDFRGCIKETLTGVHILFEAAKQYPKAIAESELMKLLPGTFYMDPPDGGSPTVLEQLQRMAKDAERYRKLQGWMGSNLQEGWKEVENLGALCAWMDWQTMDEYLDGLPVCNVGLMYKRSTNG